MISILLSEWPTTNAEWENSKLEEEFTQILKAREVVSRAIEPLRADKKVGSSLEVAVYVNVKDNAVLKANEEELCNIFITSQACVTDEKPSDVLKNTRKTILRFGLQKHRAKNAPAAGNTENSIQTAFVKNAWRR